MYIQQVVGTRGGSKNTRANFISVETRGSAFNHFDVLISSYKNTRSTSIINTPRSFKMRMDKPHFELSTNTMRRWSFTRTVFYLIFSVLVIGNFALFFQHFGLIQHPVQLQWPSAGNAYHAFERKDVSPESGELEERSTLWTAPSVSCDLCPAADDFCMELG
jgi:hypothetical protein